MAAAWPSQQPQQLEQTTAPAHTPDLYMFNVRVAHAIPVLGSAQRNYQVWTEGWTVALAGSKTTSFWRLKDIFRSAFQDYKLPKGMNCYSITLIYYPKQQDPDTLTERSWSIALDDDELLGQKITHEEFFVTDIPKESLLSLR